MSIRFKINLFDQQNKVEDDDVRVETSMEDSRSNTMRTKNPFKFGHIILGAPQKSCSFSEVSAANSDNPAFSQFTNKFNHFIRTNYNSEFSDNDLHSIVGSATSVCLQILELNCNNSNVHFLSSYSNTAS